MAGSSVEALVSAVKLLHCYVDYSVKFPCESFLNYYKNLDSLLIQLLYLFYCEVILLYVYCLGIQLFVLFVLISFPLQFSSHCLSYATYILL
jgi:hypothetical protein